MSKFDPNNPAHVRARTAIQGWLWTLHEAGLEVIDAEELEKLKALHAESKPSLAATTQKQKARQRQKNNA